MKKFFALTAISATLLLGGPSIAAESGTKAVNSIDFSLKLFEKEVEANRDQNCLISPFSASEALSMTANGAGGNTKNAMVKTLSGSDDIKALNAHNMSVLATLNKNKSVQLAIANAVFADKSTAFKPTFISLCQSLYQAEARTVDFKDKATVAKINKWCENKTHGKIPAILERLDPREKIVLLNSVYFKGAWADRFKTEETRPQDFHLSADSVKQVPMMHKSSELGYLRGQGFEAVRLAYAGSKQMMYVFLPDKNSDLKSFTAQLTADNWQKWLPAFSQCKVNLSMPRYKMHFSTKMNDSLKSLGMGAAFSGDADFSNMFLRDSGKISRVLQKTYMDVNEEGTEAAAVTAVVGTFAALHVEPRSVTFVVDRPFVVSIVDGDSGEILFLGAVTDPR